MQGNQYGVRKLRLEERLARSIKNKGSKSHFWKGGRTRLDKQIRTLFVYKLWRESVFKRDNYTCIECKQRGGKLHADHKIPFHKILQENKIRSIEEAVHFPLLWDIHNGRTLCIECHKQTDTYLRNGLNHKTLDLAQAK